MIFYPIFSAVALASGTLLQKIVLKSKKMDIKLTQVCEFLAIVLCLLPFIYFFWELNPKAFELKNFLIFGLVILFSIIANLFTYYSVKGGKISNLEPAKILEPLFVILLAVLFSFFIDSHLYERNFKIIILALIAGTSLIFAHIKKNHLVFKKYFIAAIFGSFFFALELVISRLILDFYSPVTFYFLRCSSIFLISLILFRPKFEKLDKPLYLKFLGLGVLWSVYRIFLYYGYLSLGILSTTLVVMLAPLLIFFFAWKFLNEKINWKNILATIVIVACILFSFL